MSRPIHLISSMATKGLLVDLALQYEADTGQAVRSESVGGLHLMRRVLEGEPFDGVALAAQTIDELIATGHVVAGSRVDLVRSGVAMAVRAGAPLPDIATEAALRAAVMAAASLSYSTGPSGLHLAALFERWGLADVLAARTVQAPPGVPVGQLLDEGKAEIGFQQFSELLHLPGITIVGPLPPDVQLITTFSIGIATASTQPAVLAPLLRWLASDAAAAAKRHHGMEPV